MCGFGFLHDPSLPPGELEARGRRSRAALTHRGPDEATAWQDGPAVAAFCRLAIVDLAGSHQPMADPSARWHLAFNGEIYNYREVRPSLAGRWRFRTGGDTEVLLAGLVLDGAGFLARLEGMWAFALWDAAERTLLAGRDRFGKKPLFYTARGERFACASELPALAQLAPAAGEDLDSTADYLRYGFALPGRTALRDVSEVRPGSVLTWRPGAAPRERRYWSLAASTASGGDGIPDDRAAAAGELRRRLVSAVERRLVADVEVGALLSGGVDSSLVVGILRRELGVPVKTFSIGFAEAAYDESPFARRVAAHFGTDHHEEIVTGFDRELLERLVLAHAGQPFADPSLLPTAVVARLAGRSVKVALSGDGGDELFSGYQRYQGHRLLAAWHRLPAPVRSAAAGLLGVLPEPRAHHSRSLLKKAHLFLRLAAQAESAYVAPRLLTEPELALLAPQLAGRGHEPPPAPDEPALLARLARTDVAVYLPQDILAKVDRASMAFSLEVRAPLLDRHVAELAMRLPPRWHRRGLAGKRMLRAAFPDLLPDDLWRRRKQGFAVPVGRWFDGPLGDELAARAAAPSPLEPEAVRGLLQRHRAGEDLGLVLWALYVYLLWRDAVRP